MVSPGSNKVTASEVEIEELQLGHSNLEFELETRADVARVVRVLTGQAQHTLLLHTRDLEAPVYDHQEVIDALAGLASRNRQARIWILVQNGRSAIQHGHRLIELARRLNTFIQFRRPGPDDRGFPATFLLADDSGYIYRSNASRFEGTANLHDPGKLTGWRKYFMEVWERGEPDPELKRLHL